MKIAILHYSLPPVVGGVEAVIQAHSSLFLHDGYSVRLVGGVGDPSALPEGAEFVHIPEMDSRHPSVVEISNKLDAGDIPANFEAFTTTLEEQLEPILQDVETVIIHNIFTKHFNLPLTAALHHLLDERKFRGCIVWCHDFTWTSPHSRKKVHEGYPWDLLRTYREDTEYVVVSKHRQVELAGLFQCDPQQIKVVYNGVDPTDIYSLSDEGEALAERLGLKTPDLILLMPVRITQAKNIELALQLIAQLKTQGINPRLVITGPPDPHDPGDMQYYQRLLLMRKDLDVEKEARFVYESGPQPGEGYIIGLPLVRQLYRLCDAVFMPSHREGFGMPILEAGLLGMTVFTTDIPAAVEIGGQEVIRFENEAPVEEVADMIRRWYQTSATLVLRQRVRQRYTWQAIFQQEIIPLLKRGDSA